VVTLWRPIVWEKLVRVSLATSKAYHTPVGEYLVGRIPPAVLEAFGELFPLACLVVARGKHADHALPIGEPADLD
jgi:hypothetical protein